MPFRSSAQIQKQKKKAPGQRGEKPGVEGPT
jgi:hypothetical protein